MNALNLMRHQYSLLLLCVLDLLMSSYTLGTPHCSSQIQLRMGKKKKENTHMSYPVDTSLLPKGPPQITDLPKSQYHS